MDKIVKKSVNERFLDGVFYNKAKLKAQGFAEAEVTKAVTSEVPRQKFSITMLTRYSSIPWDELLSFDTNNWQANINSKAKNEKLHELTFKFRKRLKHEYFGDDETGSKNPNDPKEMSDIYILEKYIEEAKLIATRLVQLAKK